MELKATWRSIKELIDSLCNPLVGVKRYYLLACQPAREPPMIGRLEGGCFYGNPRGFPWSSYGGETPCAFACLSHAWRSQQGLAEPTQMQFGIVGYTKTLDSLFRYVMIVSKVVLLLKTIVREKDEQIRNHSHAEISNF